LISFNAEFSGKEKALGEGLSHQLIGVEVDGTRSRVPFTRRFVQTALPKAEFGPFDL